MLTQDLNLSYLTPNFVIYSQPLCARACVQPQSPLPKCGSYIVLSEAAQQLSKVVVYISVSIMQLVPTLTIPYAAVLSHDSTFGNQEFTSHQH